VEYAASISPSKASLNASLYTAAEGVNKQNGAETLFTIDPRNPLQVQHLTAKSGKRRHTAQTAQITTAEGTGVEMALASP